MYFKRVESLKDLRIRQKESAHGDESLHYLYARIYCRFTSQNRSKHCDSVFSKYVWKFSSTTFLSYKHIIP